MGRGEGGKGLRWAKGAGKGREAGSLRIFSHLHFRAFPFDFNHLLGEPIDFKGYEFSITDAFSRIKGDWNLHGLSWLYHIHAEVHLEVGGIGVQTIYAGEKQEEGA